MWKVTALRALKPRAAAQRSNVTIGPSACYYHAAANPSALGRIERPAHPSGHVTAASSAYRGPDAVTSCHDSTSSAVTILHP